MNYNIMAYGAVADGQTVVKRYKKRLIIVMKMAADVLLFRLENI